MSRLVVEELSNSILTEIREELKKQSVVTQSKALQYRQRLLEGLVALESSRVKDSLSDMEVLRRFRVLRYEYELFFLKTQQLSTDFVLSVISSTFSAIREQVNSALGLSLIEDGVCDEISIDFV